MNVTKHRQAILIFGVVLPTLFILGLAGGALKARTQINQDYHAKVTNLESHESARVQVIELDAYLSTQHRREEIEYWNSKLGQDFIQSLTENLNRILSKYEPDVLTQTAMGQASGASSFGTQVENPSSRIQLSFEGGFKPMQLLLAELESEMPHLVLESINIVPIAPKNETETGRLGFTVIYLCWDKPKA